MGALKQRDMATCKNKTTLCANQKHTFIWLAFVRNLTDCIRALFAEVDMGNVIQDNSTAIIRSTAFFTGWRSS
ncbi:hypothetical protein RvY_02566 [Ramazzottius varieornatus]|uniref:Uncharacterized protein n=1 Tax=Ramazzottius varieornatus TaxID=947166 RepID=A0A1D1US79_RAMVA|nr:hypothetical protein RvY_02566 [Ramazzottius varieornatus]